MQAGIGMFFFLFCFFFIFFFYKGPTKQKKKCHKKTHPVAVFNCRTIIVGNYNVIIHLACAYNIDNLYYTGRINPPGMEKVVYIVCAYYTYTEYMCGY